MGKLDTQLNAFGSGRNTQNDAKKGYYRTDDATTRALLSYLQVPEPGRTINIFDPCCGEGIVLSDIAIHLSSAGATINSHGIEIDASRAATARNQLTHVRHASYDDVTISNESMGLLFLNPPYGNTLPDKDGKTDRLVHVFYRKNVHYLSSRGILALLIPVSDLTPGFCQGLSRFRNLQVFRAAVDTYKQVLIIAQNTPKRGSNEIDKDIYKTLVSIGKKEVLPPPIHEVEATQSYQIPPSKPPQFVAHYLSVEDAHHLAMNHPQKDVMVRAMFKPEMPIPAPLTRVQDGHIATALIPSGVINGEILAPDGPMNIQGTTYRETVKRMEIKVHFDSTSEIEHTKDLTQSEIIAWRKKDGGKLEILRVTREAANKTTTKNADDTTDPKVVDKPQ